MKTPYKLSEHMSSQISMIILMLFISYIPSDAQQGIVLDHMIDSIPTIAPATQTGIDDGAPNHFSPRINNATLSTQKIGINSPFQSLTEEHEKGSMTTFALAKKEADNYMQGNRSSSMTDTDGDGLLDNIDLCPDHMDTALDFDGVDDFVTVPHNAALNIGVGDFTLEAWVNSTKVGHQSILCKGVGHTGSDYFLSIELTSVLGFYFADEWHYGATPIPINAWSHVAVSYDYLTQDVTFYVNGVVDVVVNYPNPPVTSDMNSLYIGQAGYSCQCLPFEGRMDDVAIWNIKRSTEEIACGMARGLNGSFGLVAYYDMNEVAAAACMDNTSETMIADQSPTGLYGGLLNNFSLLPGCTSNWSSGRNLDSDQDGLGDGCDSYCYEDFDGDGILDNLDLCPFNRDVALDFDGIDDHVAVPHNVALNVSGGDFTLQAWVNPTASGWSTILSKGYGGAEITDYLFTINPSSLLGLNIKSGWTYSTTAIPLNTWSHVAVSFNFTTKQATFYLNGIADGGGSFPAQPTPTDTNPLFIGQQGYNCACNHFEGRMDDVVIWNTTRSAEEITCSMAKQLTGSEAGLVAFYEMNESGACMDNTSTTMITDQSPNGFDGLLNNFSLLPGCTSNWSSGRNLDSDQNGIGDGCDGICIPDDIDRDGILNSIDLCPDYMDTALDFDGIDDHITVAHQAALNVGRGDFTFQAWVSPTANDYRVILAKGADFSGGTNYKWDIVPASTSAYKLRFFYGNEAAPLSTTAIPLNEWNHIAMTFESTTKQAVFYLNGVADGMVNYTNVPDTTDTNPLYIGRLGIGCPCAFFEGQMDDLSIWNTKRTAAEITCGMTSLTGSEVGLVAFYEMNESPACLDNTSNTMIVDQSPNGFGGQLNNFSLFPGCTSNWSSGRNLDSDQDGLGDGCSICFDFDGDDDGILDSIDLCPDYMDTALDFDGVDDHITVPHNAALNVGGGDFAFQAWINPTAPGWSTILSKGTGLFGTSNYYFSINPSSVLGLSIENQTHYSTTAIPLNTWSHVAVSFNFTTKQATFYLNGIADGVGSYPNAPPSDTGPLFIGQQGYDCACNRFEGRIDDVAIWNKQRTASDLTADMATKVDVSEAGLVASYDMNEAAACLDNTSNTMIADQSPNDFGGLLNNFSLLPSCTSNWSSGRNLDSDQDGFGDGCDYRCNTGLPVLYVDSSAISGKNLGNSWADAYVSLSEALYHAGICPDIDSIHVAAGTYFPDIAGLANPRTASFVILDSVHILGQFPTGGGNLSTRDTLHQTILSGDIGVVGDSRDNAYHVVVATNITSQSSVDGFVITNGLANGDGIDNSGGGWLNDNASPRMNRCVFRDNLAIASGGGLFNFNSSPTISNCYFTNCTSVQGGAMSNETSSPTISDCSFTGNTAVDLSNYYGLGGGVCNLDGSAPIFTTCMFTSNTAEFGGGIFNESSATINHCTFTGNTANSSRTNANGGGVAIYSALISSFDSCVFNGNDADYGGGLYCDSSMISIVDCQFETNMATQHGGGVYLSVSPLSAHNTTFTGNTSNSRGGGLYCQNDSVSLTDCQFSMNTAGNGGGIYVLSSPLVAQNVSLTDNTSSTRGGGLYSYNASVSLIDCQFSTNTAIERGGGAFLWLSPLVAQNDSFADNASNLYGGGIYCTDASVFLMDCQFNANTANERGGGVALASAPLIAQNVSFTDNTSNYAGGGLYSSNASVSLMDCQFNANTAIKPDGGNSYGGGAIVASAPLVAQNVTFTDNSSGYVGGGLFSQHASVSLTTCEFTNNTAVLSGGGMFLLKGSLNAQHCNFSSNAATQTISRRGFGGGIAVQDVVSQLLFSCDFSGNSSVGGGGAVSSYNTGVSLVKNCNFRNNQVHNGSTIGTGGAYQVAGTGQTDIFNSLFEGNQALGSADDGGGAIMIYGGGVNLINSTLVNNFSATKGGAVSLFNNTGTFNSQNSILWNNTSATDSLVYNGNGGSATMSYSLIDADSCVSNVLCDAGMIYNQDPQFVDAMDFRLQLFSPAINAGDTTGIFNQLGLIDLDSMPRFESCQIDMGAYEYQGLMKPMVYVDESAQSGNNHGNSWANAYLRFSDAMKLAAGCTEIDSIYVATGTYVPDTSGLANPRQASFVIPEGVIILGQFPSGGGSLSQRDTLYETILSGDIGIVNDSLDNAYHVISATNITSASSVDGFIITKGLANGGGVDAYGAGWYNVNASSEISNCTFTLNTASGRGGGLYSAGGSGSISLVDCKFVLNTASVLGGGVYSHSSPLTAQNVTFTSNSAQYGGGLYNYLDSVSLINCQFTLNKASSVGAAAGFGGGVMVHTSPLIAQKVTFTSNESDWGGGLFYQGDVTSLVDCNFSANTATLGGGAVSSYNTGVSEIKNSTFEFNLCHNGSTLGTGGAFQVDGTGQTNFFNCLFEANQGLGSSEHGGGAIDVYAGEVSITNSTIVNNQSATLGGAISIRDNTGVLSMINTVLWNNTAPTDGIIYNGNGGSATMSYSLIDADNCVSNVLCNAGMIYNQNPLFLDAANGDFSLSSISPARNAGDGPSGSSANTTNFDLLGNPRFVDLIDLGAFENQCVQSMISNLVLDINDSPLNGIYDASQSIIIDGAVEVMPGITVELRAPLVNVGVQMTVGIGANIIVSPDGCN